MSCKKCGENLPIVNKWFGLCKDCNNERLHGSKYGKQYKHTQSKRKSLKSDLNSSFAWDMMQENKPSLEKVSMYEKDNEFYKKCFDTFNHKCEECGVKQPKEFLDSNGKVNARHRYSHIVPKSIAPELRHELENINDLCLKCHTKWEGPDKAEMKIYKTNKLREKLKKYFIKLF